MISVLSADDQLAIDRRYGVLESDEWAIAIGRSIILFGRVEHSVTLVIRQCASDAIGRKVARLDLSARLH
jgi:hypothetical protein